MRPELAHIAQRVSVEYHLGPLNLEEVGHYMRHRLEVAGGSGELFAAEAMAPAYYFSGGVPRLGNTPCDYALAFAYARGPEQTTLPRRLEVVRKSGRASG